MIDRGTGEMTRSFDHGTTKLAISLNEIPPLVFEDGHWTTVLNFLPKAYLYYLESHEVVIGPELPVINALSVYDI